jgi:hypothetical protein
LSVKADLIKIVRALSKKVEAMDAAPHARLPEPQPKPEKIPEGETYIESLHRKTRDNIAAGRVVSMSAMLHEEERQRQARRIPRSPEEARAGWRWWR